MVKVNCEYCMHHHLFEEEEEKEEYVMVDILRQLIQ